MAKGKVHMLAGIMSGTGGPDVVTVACHQGHRKLLPLLTSSDWREVTCKRCRTHAPPAPRLSVFDTMWAWFKGGRR